jgi:hypothetical protein
VVYGFHLRPLRSTIGVREVHEACGEVKAYRRSDKPMTSTCLGSPVSVMAPFCTHDTTLQYVAFIYGLSLRRTVGVREVHEPCGEVVAYSLSDTPMRIAFPYLGPPESVTVAPLFSVHSASQYVAFIGGYPCGAPYTYPRHLMPVARCMRDGRTVR